MEMLKTDIQYAAFCALFMLMLGCAIGCVIAYHQPSLQLAAQAQYNSSVVSNTYNNVEEQIKSDAIPLWVGVVALILIFIINNLGVATLISFLPWYFNGWLGVLTTSYLLFTAGFIPGMIYARVLTTMGGVVAFAAFAPHGVFEFAGVIIAGASAYYFILSGCDDNSKKYVKSMYFKYVVPLIIIAAILEVFLTPLIIYHILY